MHSVDGLEVGEERQKLRKSMMDRLSQEAENLIAAIDGSQDRLSLLVHGPLGPTGGTGWLVGEPEAEARLAAHLVAALRAANGLTKLEADLAGEGILDQIQNGIGVAFADSLRLPEQTPGLLANASDGVGGLA